MEPALAWLESPPVGPVIEVATEPVGGHGGAAGAGPHGPRAVGTLYEGLVGRTPTAQLVAADLLAGPDARAASLAPVIPRGAAVARQSAVWVHTGRLRPDRLSIVVPPQRRVHTGATVHRQRLADADVVHLAGVPTTTRVRTAVDLLCFAAPDVAVAGLQLLLGSGLTAEDVRAALALAVGLPNRRARGLLVAATGGKSHGPDAGPGSKPC